MENKYQGEVKTLIPKADINVWTIFYSKVCAPFTLNDVEINISYKTWWC